jgi:PAS domain S-box-containing protein
MGDAGAQEGPGASSTGPGAELAWLDRDGVIVSVNDAWREFCTANNGDLDACGPGASYLEVCEADPAAAPVARAIREQLAGTLRVPVVFTLPRDGPTSARRFDLHLSPRLDEQGAVDGVIVGLVPVTRPVAGPSAEPLVTDLIEHAPDGALLVDAEGVIRYANRQLVALSGYAREALVGQPVEILVGDARRSRHRRWREGYQRAPRDRAMGTGMTLGLLRQDGTELPVEISLAPMVAQGTTMTFASVRDVREIRAQDHARRRLLFMLDLDPDAVYVMDAETSRIEYANSGATALLGYSQEELLSMTLREVTPESTPEWRRTVQAQHEAAGLGHTQELQVLRRAKDGSLIPCDARSQLVEGPDGRRAYIIVDRAARPRLAAEADRRRQLELSQLVTGVSQMVLSDAPSGELYQRVVAGAASLVDAQNASLVVYDPLTNRVDTLAVVGPVAEARARGGVFLDMHLVLPWMRATSPVLLPDGPPVELPSDQPRKGPGVVAQFRGTEDRLGLLAVFRRPGQEPFTESEGVLLAELAGQVALVVEIGRARMTSQRLEIVEERQRIARDLHDMVIQDLIGIGMQLADSSEADPGSDPGDTHELVSQLDDTIRRLRLVVFDARTTALHGSVSEEIRRTVREAARTLDHRPDLTLDAAVDDLPAEVVSHLLSVLREGLSNVARHARASSTQVAVTVADGTVSVCIEDDGCGLGDRTLHGTGTASMRERAEMVSGTISLTDRADGGAQLLWTASVAR